MRALGLSLIAAGAIAGAAELAAGPSLPPHDAAAAKPPSHPLRVMSLNQCADQIVLALLPPERITSVTWLNRDPLTSRMVAEAERVASITDRPKRCWRNGPISSSPASIRPAR